MKNKDILALASQGVMTITNHDLGIESAYKVYKFKKVFKAKYLALSEALQDLLHEVGIEDAPEFDRRRNELFERPERTPEEERELKEAVRITDMYMGLRYELLQEDVDMTEVKKLSFADWKALQDENRSTEGRDVLVGISEDLLEGVLWDDPQW